MNYNPEYKVNQKMTNDVISKEALALIAALNLQYWCEDEKEKVSDIVKTIMESVVDWEVPLFVSQDYGTDLYETK